MNGITCAFLCVVVILLVALFIKSGNPRGVETFGPCTGYCNNETPGTKLASDTVSEGSKSSDGTVPSASRPPYYRLSVNPFVWPYSATTCLNTGFQQGINQPVPVEFFTNNDLVAERIRPNNRSGMTIASIPDESYMTN
jgi:hypothetical protein